ncbi:hypothetical protein BGX27_010725, partial [Mortierella sp. AM989]
VRTATMAPESIVESEELQHMLYMRDYDSESAVRTLDEGPKRGGTNKGDRVGYENTVKSIGSIGSSTASGTRATANNRSNRANENDNRSRRKSSSVSRIRKSKIGGNSGQMLIDPWLSTGIPAFGLEDDLHGSPSFRSSQSHRSNEGTVRSPRPHLGISRFDHEPLALMSTSATAPGMLRDETPGPSFASPRKKLVDTIEINCSDQEEVEIDDSQVQRQTILSKGISGKQKGSKKIAPMSAGTPNRRRLVRANSSLLSINVISSSDEEYTQHPTTPIRSRKIAREILDSSDDDDDDDDELSRGVGKNALNSFTNHHRSSVYPVADDTIPRSPEHPETPTSSPTAIQPGSTAKMPWSITEGPDRDIVLSTPTSKQRIRHYNVILDSEDELSETEKLPEVWSIGERNSFGFRKHLGLPGTDSVVEGGARKSPSRAIVSDSEAEVGVTGATQTEQSDPFIITQSTMDERDEAKARVYVVESQDAYDLSGRRVSPEWERQDFQVVTKLRKPRPLVLDVLSDEDTDAEKEPGSKEAKYKEAKAVKEQHTELRKTLMFEDIIDEESPSPTPDQLLRSKLDPKKEQRKFENSSFSNFPIFNRTLRPTQKNNYEPKVNDNEPHEFWKRKNENEDNRLLTEVTPPTAEDEEEEEPLEDSRARRHPGRSLLASPYKKMKLSEVAPDVAAMESALKTAAAHARQQAIDKNPCQLSRMETIESFSTLSDSQRTVHRVDPGSSRIFSQAEEIDDFSDDVRSQMPEKRQEERRTRRYSGLHFVSRDQPNTLFKSLGVDNMAGQIETNNWERQLDLSRDKEQQHNSDQAPLDPHESRDISPTLSQNTLEKCPICRMMIPAEDLLAHVDEELLANEQREKDDMERQDEAMAFALNKVYQTQDVATISDSLPETEFLMQDTPLARTKLPTSADRQPHSTRTLVRHNDWRRNDVSLDTPTRKVSRLTLDASPSPPPSPSNAIENARDLEGGFLNRNLQRISSSSTISSDDVVENEQEYEHNSIVLSEVESLSSQSAFKIQPGQIIIHDTPSLASDTTLPATQTSRISPTAQKPHKPSRGRKPEGENVLAPFVIQDDALDDDLNDFLDRPEPASMMNRSFRTITNASTSASVETSSRGSSKRSPRSRTANISKNKPSKGMVELDDSDDEPHHRRDKNEDTVSVSSRLKSVKGSKSKFSVLDSILPASARQRRQHLLTKNHGRRGNSVVDVEDEIEIGRHRPPVMEKLWNQEDDPFDSEYLDPRQVKGVGLGGVVGGIGAIPGSLAISKITKNTAAASDPTSELDAVLLHLSNESSTKLDSFELDGSLNRARPSFELEDPGCDLHSQDWWDNPQLGNPEYSHESNELRSHITVQEQGQEELDDGYKSPLDDFVDLRKRRDDPALAMYFAQFGAEIGVDNGNTGSSASGGRGRGRSRSRNGRGGSKPSGRKRSVSYGPGVGPITATTATNNQEPENGQAVLTAYGIPRRTGSTAIAPETSSSGQHDRYGARRVSFGGHATTENGSMAIRSKPTQPFVPGKNRGRGKATGRGGSKSYRSGRWTPRGGRGGRGGRGQLANAAGAILSIVSNKGDQNDSRREDVTYKVLYLKLHGMAATTRIILAIAGVKWESIYPTDWTVEKHQAPLGVLPILYEHHASTGLVLEIPESEAIERYLARKFGLLGRDAWEETTINVFYSSSNAVMSLYVNKVLLAFPDTKSRELTKFVERDVPGWIKQHEKWLAKNDSGSGYYVGDQLSLADIRSVICLDRYLTIPECRGLFSATLTPGLFKLKQTLETNPRYAAWMASDEFEAINISTRHRLAVLSG